jgi:hypothetical protein
MGSTFFLLRTLFGRISEEVVDGYAAADLVEDDGALAASTAAFARPCSASIGALRADRGRGSSDSSSDEAAVLGTMP